MFTDYAVIIEEFAEKHFIKSFQKKYLKRWEVTLKAIKENTSRIEILLKEKPNYGSLILKSDPISIYKLRFKIATTDESVKTSGHRCIIATDSEKMTARVLLVYSKTDIGGSDNETAKWKQLIRDNYSDLKNII